MNFITLPSSLAALLIAVTGCSQSRVDGPPDIRYGHAECAHCGMIVSEDRYASAICVTLKGEYHELAYDDLRCMYVNDRKEKYPADARRYVHDVDTRKWLKAEEAKFIRDPDTHTPMGSGVLAFEATSPRAAQGVSYDQIDTLIKKPSTQTASDAE